jgi:predicted glycosyltransferase
VRAIFFCNEMLGLGHLRLSIALAQALVHRDDRATSLIVTGSGAFPGLSLPRNVDLLKLPTLPVDPGSAWGATTHRPPTSLAMPTEEVSALRSAISTAAIRALAPEVVVVDYKPTGRNDELLGALDLCRRRHGGTIALGLWEVDDAPERLRAEWTPARLEAVRELYDLVLIYGPTLPGDVRAERLRATGMAVRHTGIVASAPAQHGPADLDDGYLLATAGGGADGFALLDALLGAIRRHPLALPAVLVAGPNMPVGQVARLRDSVEGLDAVVIHQRPDMEELLAGARAVVAMAGYCTVAEILASGRPALLVPRAVPREEQLNRARLLAAAGRVHMLDPHELGPDTLAAALALLLEQPARPRESLGGADEAARILLAHRANVKTVTTP